MIERPVLKEGQIKFIGDQRRSNVMRHRRVAFYRRQRPWAAAFIGHRIRIADT